MEVPTNREADEIDNLLADDPEFEEFAIAEDELIDAYVRDELSKEDKKVLENAMKCSPRLEERVDIARMLAKASSLYARQKEVPIDEVERKESDDQPSYKHPRRPGWKRFIVAPFVPQWAFRLALVGCAVLLILSGVLIAGWMKSRNETQRLAALEQQRQELEKRSLEERARSGQLTAELQTAKVQQDQDRRRIEELNHALNQIEQSDSETTPSIVASILLSPGLTRNGGGNDLTVQAGASTIKLRLLLETNEYPTYSAIIKNSQAVQVQKNGIKPTRTSSGKILVVQFPAKRLPPGDYIVSVSGITSSGVVEGVHDYTFRVRRKQE